MLIKKFQGKTEDEAILAAKEDLGKDVVIMNVKTVKPKGIYKLFKKGMFEVTAAIDETIVYDIKKTKDDKDDFPLGKEVVPMTRTEELLNKEVAKKQKNSIDILSEDSPENGEINSLKIEDRLNNLQELLEKQMKAKIEEEKVAKSESVIEEVEEKDINGECMDLIKKQLINNEVDEKYVDVIMKEIQLSIKKDAALDNVLANIYQKIVLKLGQPKVIKNKENQPKFVFFVGPTGVGKTTTIAKIASNLKVKEKMKIALITSDTYRIAAVEQLRIYANILSVPLKVVYSSGEMEQVKEELENYDLVLIDTAGRSHKSEEQQEDVANLINTIPKEEREVYLVLSTTTKYNDLVKIAETYKRITEYSLIFTKLDETSGIGNILNIKMFTNASLSYATLGQNVPDDIEKIDVQKIAKQLLGGQ